MVDVLDKHVKRFVENDRGELNMTRTEFKYLYMPWSIKLRSISFVKLIVYQEMWKWSGSFTIACKIADYLSFLNFHWSIIFLPERFYHIFAFEFGSGYQQELPTYNLCSTRQWKTWKHSFISELVLNWDLLSVIFKNVSVIVGSHVICPSYALKLWCMWDVIKRTKCSWMKIRGRFPEANKRQ